MSVSSSSHYCGSPGCTVSRSSNRRHCSSPGCTGGANSEPNTQKLIKPFDPTGYKLIDNRVIGQYVVLKVKYDDAPAYGGVKILVYRATIADLWKQKSLDPHFVTTGGYICPIARFPATEEGWLDAQNYARSKLLD